MKGRPTTGDIPAVQLVSCSWHNPNIIRQLGVAVFLAGETLDRVLILACMCTINNLDEIVGICCLHGRGIAAEKQNTCCAVVFKFKLIAPGEL